MSGAEFARFARDLGKAAAAIAKGGEGVAATVGRGALKTAQSITPVETGELRRGLRLVRRGEVAIIETTTEYAVYQEFGTSVMAPNPFIRPTVDQWEPRLVGEVEKLRDKVVRLL